MSTRRFIALMMALMLIVTALSGLTITAAADEVYAEADVYTLNYDGAYTGPVYQYMSPYRANAAIGDMSGNILTFVFSLYNTDSANAEKPDIIAAYCTDVEVEPVSDADYRRVNLEDSTYAANVAGQLRAIVRNGFPSVDAKTLGEAANVENLTVCEAMNATQYAIWLAAHNGKFQIRDYFSTMMSAESWAEGTDYANQTANYAECYAEVASGYASTDNELIEEHITTVCNYLLSLDPVAPTGAVASESSFVDWKAIVSDADDNGNCTITVTATVDVTVGASDSLTLTAIAGDYSASTALNNGKNSYVLTINDVPADVAAGNITLAIDGTQALEDVYLFDAAGGREASQSLIGITASALPVHAEVSANDRILVLNKRDGNVALQNIVFDIYYVCSVEEYWNGDVSIGTTVVEGEEYFAAPSDADIAKYATGLPVATITTDASGKASFNFGSNDGIYLVVERENAITTGAVDPFFVALPGGEMVENTDKYVVEVDVKNTVKQEDVIIEKDVTEIDNDWSTYDVGEIHTWIIQSSIPTGMATGLKYEITDTLNYQLTYVGNVVVTVSEKTAKAGEDLLVLKEGEDYILTVTPGTETINGVEEAITSFKVALTKTGMEKVAAVEGTEPEVRVYFDAYIDDDAIMATEIPNQAHIDYENNVGVDFEKDSDIPVVITGGTNLLKVDASNHDKVLEGATFNVYREATTEEITDENVVTVKMEVPVTTDGVTTMVEKDLVQVSFYNNAALVGPKVTEAVSDKDGKAVVYGLAYGTYYLVETKAPAGYNMLTGPVEIVIDATSHTDAEVVTIYNAAGFKLPETGGEGTGMFMIAGVIIIAAAMMLIVVPKKKNA